ncbi:MAG: hypothetical protein WDN27_00405 [Candidatus Saccharibacteria bacterium]
MAKIEKLLEKEMTRKQFLLALLSGVVGFAGISAFLGAFTRGIDSSPSELPGYGMRGYGP